MSITDLIEELKVKEIEVSFSAGRLKYQGPDGEVTAEIIEKLKANKAKLIKYFWPKEFVNLMPINTDGTKSPLFLVHGDNGNYLLSNHLGSDQPVYGFFHPGSEGEEILFNNVEEMAKKYLDQMLAVSPSGPYYIAGFSFGGVLAYEMAIQLQKAGKVVPFLVLIDSLSPAAVESTVWHKGLYRFVRSNLLHPVRMELIRLFKIAVCRFFIFLKKPIPAGRRNFYMIDKYRILTKKYIPSKFSGKILLFRTKENRSTYKFLGWEKLVNGITLIYLDADHTTIFDIEQSSSVLSSEFEKYLCQVQSMMERQS